MGRARKYKTNAARQRAYRQRQKPKVYHRHASDLWETPQDDFDKLHAEFGFTVDVCAIAANAKCDRYYSPADDSLQQTWAGICFCNPPYSEVARWVQKACAASKAGATVVCLVYAKTDTRWWHEWVLPYASAESPGLR